MKRGNVRQGDEKKKFVKKDQEENNDGKRGD